MASAKTNRAYGARGVRLVTTPSAEPRPLAAIHSRDRLRFAPKRRVGAAATPVGSEVTTVDAITAGAGARTGTESAESAVPSAGPIANVDRLLATTDVPDLAPALARLNGLHKRLCPRQVLGVRIGLLAARLLGLEAPLLDRRVHVIVETDGCFADGVTAATGCAVGHRTLRVIDYFKTAATLVDAANGRAVRVWPNPDARNLAGAYAPDVEDRWHAQREAYQTMPDGILLRWQSGTVAVAASFSSVHPPARVACDACGEDVMGGREVTIDDRRLCRACADGSYFAAD